MFYKSCRALPPHRLVLLLFCVSSCVLGWNFVQLSLRTKPSTRNKRETLHAFSSIPRFRKCAPDSQPPFFVPIPVLPAPVGRDVAVKEIVAWKRSAGWRCRGRRRRCAHFPLPSCPIAALVVLGCTGRTIPVMGLCVSSLPFSMRFCCTLALVVTN
jgi:hypothetical protein